MSKYITKIIMVAEKLNKYNEFVNWFLSFVGK